MESSYENGIYYRNPDEILRRAHNHLVLNNTTELPDPGDREACRILWEKHLENS